MSTNKNTTQYSHYLIEKNENVWTNSYSLKYLVPKKFSPSAAKNDYPPLVGYMMIKQWISIETIDIRKLINY